jgi:hypothetical protein
LCSAFETLNMSKYTAFRCPEDLLELAKIKARKDRRSLSNYIITLIEKDVNNGSVDELGKPANAKRPKELQVVH